MHFKSACGLIVVNLFGVRNSFLNLHLTCAKVLLNFFRDELFKKKVCTIDLVKEIGVYVLINFLLRFALMSWIVFFCLSLFFSKLIFKLIGVFTVGFCTVLYMKF